MTPYGFHARLKAEFPSQVIVDVTEVCNLACIHCPHPVFKKSGHYGGRQLDFDLHERMVSEVGEWGPGHTQYVRYTSNGEPLAHPRIYDMLHSAVTRCGVFVTLTTNGTILDTRRVENVLASGLHLVDVSIDAVTTQTYSRVRVDGRLDVTRRNVLGLLETRQRLGARTKIVVSFVEQPENVHEVTEFEAYWRSQGVDEVVIRRLHSAAGGVKDIADTLRAEQAGTLRRPCLYPWERILLNARGELTFCPQDWVRGSVLADYRQTTIREVWQGPYYRTLREAHLRNEFGDHPFCGQCPDWKQTRWPWQGRSYADLVQDLTAEP